ncbi:hypothetical protein AK973_5217 [Pseudomonas brassicacearum]|nr:hypothetical protein AK973_5217 [Pseudomonas brassicacearum]
MRHLTRLQNLQHQIVGIAAKSGGAGQLRPSYPWPGSPCPNLRNFSHLLRMHAAWPQESHELI